MLALVLAAANASGAALFAGWFAPLHAALHQHELWLLAVSALLVAAGGALELRARRPGQAFPWLFAVSAACLAINSAIIVAH